MAFQSKSEQRAALSTNYSGNTATLQSSSVKGPKDMGDNGPRRLFGNMSTSGKNGEGLKGGKLFGKTGSAKSSSGVGGSMSATGYTSPPRQSMASGAPTKPTTMKMGEGTVHAKVQARSAGPKSIRGGSDGE